MLHVLPCGILCAKLTGRMISLVAPKPHSAMEHCQMFKPRRTSWLNPASEHLFDAGYRDLDYTYDPPRQDYEPGRLVRSPEERNFRVIGAVNQWLQPVPQKMSTTTSGAINRIFYHRRYDYNAVSGVFIWPNRDPIQEFGGLNLYAYVFNNPINWIDLYGLSFSGRFGNGLVGAGAGAITGGGVGAVAGLGFGDEATIPAGALAGAIAGFVAGFLSDPCFNPLKAAGTGAIHGGLAGIVGVAGEVGGVLWGAGAGLGIGGISGGLATGGDPRGIAGGAIIGVFSGGLGAGASELGPLTAGVFYGASEAGGQEFGELMNILR
jgi:RHS repeat-associated protein